MMDFIINKITNIEKFKRKNKIFIVLFIDYVSFNLSLFILYLVNKYFSINNFLLTPDFYYYISTPLIFILFIYFKVYQSIFRYFGLRSILKIILPFISSFALISIIYVLSGLYLNLFFISIHLALFYIFILFSRIIISYLLNFKVKNKKINNLIFLGINNDSQKFMKLFDNYKIKGFIDYDNKNAFQTIDTYPIYPFKEIDEVINKNKIKFIFVTLNKLTEFDKQQIQKKITNHDIILRFLPSYDDIVNKINFLDNISDIRIEDLIDRKINKNNDLIKNYFKDKKVLITGAGGSIGKELSLQILNLNPESIFLIENSEYNLYSVNLLLETQIQRQNFKTKIFPILSNIGNLQSLLDIFNKYRPNIVFHAAAYKHVTLVESNPIESIKNNVYGSLNVLKASLSCKVEQFILISTDKAVRPKNIMGATKRLSEMILQSYVKNKENISYNIVRFGNVIGSTGSVIPLFNYQIKKNIPITVTHRDVTRYFMTIGDAVYLVLRASIFKKNGSVFVLNMGKPLRILDLAKKMIKLYGKVVKGEHNPEFLDEVSIKYIGLKDGEKMHEELFISENVDYTENKDIMVSDENLIDIDNMNRHIDHLNNLINLNNDQEVISYIFKIVNELN